LALNPRNSINNLLQRRLPRGEEKKKRKTPLRFLLLEKKKKTIFPNSVGEQEEIPEYLTACCTHKEGEREETRKRRYIDNCIEKGGKGKKKKSRTKT